LGRCNSSRGRGRREHGGIEGRGGAVANPCTVEYADTAGKGAVMGAGVRVDILGPVHDRFTAGTRTSPGAAVGTVVRLAT
jgi:hypothetical protein